jgi:elongation factor Ts
MADITAAMVKALREETGQGMMECKKALQKTEGDLEAARDLLRKKGLALADKKADRETSEGLVAIQVADDGASAAMVEVQCETDFCARNEVFQDMVGIVVSSALGSPDGAVEANSEITDAVQAALTKIGENMSYARGVRISAPKIGTYLHHNRKVGVLVGIEGEIDEETLSGLCMHIAFADPVGIRPEDIPADVVEKERAFAKQEAIDSGKPAEIAEKMVEGKMRKFLAARALLEQPFVRDEKVKVKEILGQATVRAFARFAVGG